MKTKKFYMVVALPVVVLIFFIVQMAHAESPSGDDGQHPSAIIYSVSVEPARVASGETILIEAVFSMFSDASRSTLSLKYFCEIERQGQSIFKSPVRAMDVTNGAKSHLEVKLQAVGGKGDYRVTLELLLPDGNLRETGSFSIVSPMEARMYRAELLKKNPSTKSAVENRLPGTWQIIPQDPKSIGPKIFISNENGKLTASISRKDAETLWVKLRKAGNTLMIRSKSATPAGDCWYVVEDIITLNDRMADMPVRSTVLEGSRCVSVGKVSEATLRRIE